MPSRGVKKGIGDYNRYGKICKSQKRVGGGWSAGGADLCSRERGGGASSIPAEAPHNPNELPNVKPL